MWGINGLWDTLIRFNLCFVSRVQNASISMYCIWINKTMMWASYVQNTPYCRSSENFPTFSRMNFGPIILKGYGLGNFWLSGMNPPRPPLDQSQPCTDIIAHGESNSSKTHTFCWALLFQYLFDWMPSEHSKVAFVTFHWQGLHSIRKCGANFRLDPNQARLCVLCVPWQIYHVMRRWQRKHLTHDEIV